jgi:hypothetical protein
VVARRFGCPACLQCRSPAYVCACVCVFFRLTFAQFVSDLMPWHFDKRISSVYDGVNLRQYMVNTPTEQHVRVLCVCVCVFVCLRACPCGVRHVMRRSRARSVGADSSVALAADERGNRNIGSDPLDHFPTHGSVYGELRFTSAHVVPTKRTALSKSSGACESAALWRCAAGAMLLACGVGTRAVVVSGAPPVCVYIDMDKDVVVVDDLSCLGCVYFNTGARSATSTSGLLAIGGPCGRSSWGERGRIERVDHP